MKDLIKRYLILFITFLKIGLFTFGGGYAMIPLIQRETVEKRKWLKQTEILDILSISESTPGPISVNSATYIGYRVGGIGGAVFATLGLILPSFIIIFVISLFFEQFLQFEIVRNAFKGIQCGVVVLICSAAYRLSKSFNFNKIGLIVVITTFIIVVLINLFLIPISTIWLIILGGLIGLIMELIIRRKESMK